MKEHPTRKLQRLSGYDYSQNGVYFVTICSENRKHLFGNISMNGAPIMELNPLGLIVQNAIDAIQLHHQEAKVLSSVIVPNHVHLLLEIDASELLNTSTNLSSIVKGLKASVTKAARKLGTEGKIWQKSFHDHIIRSETDLDNHYEYIITNIDRWLEDEYCNN